MASGGRLHARASRDVTRRSAESPRHPRHPPRSPRAPPRLRRPDRAPPLPTRPPSPCTHARETTGRNAESGVGRRRGRRGGAGHGGARGRGVGRRTERARGGLGCDRRPEADEAWTQRRDAGTRRAEVRWGMVQRERERGGQRDGPGVVVQRLLFNRHLITHACVQSGRARQIRLRAAPLPLLPLSVVHKLSTLSRKSTPHGRRPTTASSRVWFGKGRVPAWWVEKGRGQGDQDQRSRCRRIRQSSQAVRRRGRCPPVVGAVVL